MTASGAASSRAEVRSRTVTRDVLTVAGFAVAYLATSFLSRLALIPGSTISMVWPGAGVAAMWVLVRAGAPGRWVTYALIVVLTMMVVALSGGSPVATVTSGIANAVQTAVFAGAMRATCPTIWFSRGTRPLERPQLWWFALAAVAAPLVSSPLVQIDSLTSGGGWRWDLTAMWIARNTGSILVLIPAGLVLGGFLARRRAGAARRRFAEIGWAVRSRPGEWIFVLLLSPLVHVLWFLTVGDLAVVFPLVALAVWAGTRLPTGLASVHAGVVACVVLGITAWGFGPFQHSGSAVIEVTIAQLYTILMCLIGLALALDRDARASLSTELRAARDEARAEAQRLETIIESVQHGIRVVDRTGGLLVRNTAASRLLLGLDGTDVPGVRETVPGAETRVRFRTLDGEPVPPEKLPYRRALAGEEIRDLDLFVRPEGRGERIVSFTTSRLPDTAGAGVVTVMRDVTAEREELRRAARVQAGLLPRVVPDLPGWDLAARFRPAGTVGGDFYDWEGLPGGVVLTLADVMGKGAGAAILAATTRSLLRAHGGDRDVAATLAATDRSMATDLENAGAFVTCFRSWVDATTGEVSYSDAGHGLAAILSPTCAARRLVANGLPLGISPDEPRLTGTDRIAPGEMLLIFSDGVLDAFDGELERAWQDLPWDLRAGDAVDAIMEAASRGVVDDDLTIVALRRHQSPD